MIEGPIAALCSCTETAPFESVSRLPGDYRRLALDVKAREIVVPSAHPYFQHNLTRGMVLLHLPFAGWRVAAKLRSPTSSSAPLYYNDALSGVYRNRGRADAYV